MEVNLHQSEVVIITNNPLVNNIPNAAVARVNGSCLDVLAQVLNYLAQGHRLISHPLAGSIKPNQNPFKSVLISCQTGTINRQEMAAAHQALCMAEAMALNPYLYHETAGDLQMIDKELMEQALSTYQEGR